MSIPEVSSPSQLVLGPEDEGRLLTADEFAEAYYLEPWRYERVDGRLTVMPPDGEGHLFAASPWLELLFAYKSQRPDLIYAVAPNAWIRVHDATDRIGDIGVYLVTAVPMPKIPDRIPDLMFEVVSPGAKDKRRDYVEKRAEYEGLGIREYVIVDRFQRSVTVLALVDGRYEERVLTGSDIYTSPLLPGLSGPHRGDTEPLRDRSWRRPKSPARRDCSLGPEDEGRALSADEFAEAEYREPWRYERVDGRLIVMPPSGPGHREASEPLRDHLGAYRLAHPEIVRMVCSEAWVRRGELADRIGDIGVYLTRDDEPSIPPERAPDLMFEIVSPSAEDRRRDYVEKRADYEGLGIREYVIVDRFQRSVTVLTLAEGRYEERVLSASDFYTSPLLPGLAIPLAEVLGR